MLKYGLIAAIVVDPLRIVTCPECDEGPDTP